MAEETNLKTDSLQEEHIANYAITENQIAGDTVNWKCIKF